MAVLQWLCEVTVLLNTMLNSRWHVYAQDTRLLLTWFVIAMLMQMHIYSVCVSG